MRKPLSLKRRTISESSDAFQSFIGGQDAVDTLPLSSPKRSFNKKGTPKRGRILFLIVPVHSLVQSQFNDGIQIGIVFVNLGDGTLNDIFGMNLLFWMSSVRPIAS